MSEWVSVKDKIPDVLVLCYGKWGFDLCKFNRKQNQWHGRGGLRISTKDVTHWMIPEPPKESNATSS